MKKQTEKKIVEKPDTSTVVSKTTDDPVTVSSSIEMSLSITGTIIEETKPPVTPEVAREPAESLKEEGLPQKSQKQKDRIVNDEEEISGEEEAKKEVARVDSASPLTAPANLDDDQIETSQSKIPEMKEEEEETKDESSHRIENAERDKSTILVSKKVKSPKEEDYDSNSDSEEKGELEDDPLVRAFHRRSSDKLENPIDHDDFELIEEAHPLIGRFVSPKLQQFFNQTHLTANDLIDRGIALDEFERMLNPSLGGKALHWLMSVSWTEKLLFYMALKRQHIKLSAALPEQEAEVIAQEEQIELGQSDEYNYRKHISPSGHALLIESKFALKYAYAMKAFLESLEVVEKLWTGFVVSLLVNTIVNSFKPNGCELNVNGNEHQQMGYLVYLYSLLEEYRATEDILGKSLLEPLVWPFLLALPLSYGLMNALIATRYTKFSESVNLKKLIADLKHYRSTRWNDCWRWLISALIPDIFPAFLPALLFLLLPGPHVQHLLEKTVNLLVWDGRLSAKDRLKLFEALKKLYQKSSQITQLEVLSSLAAIADAIGLEDLAILQKAEVESETLKTLIAIKMEARTELLYAASHYHLHHQSKKSALQPLPRYVFSHYLLWCLGEPRSILLQPLFLFYRGFKLFSKIFFIMALVKGIREIIVWELEKYQCEHKEGKIWRYIPSYGQEKCVVCPDMEVFVKNMFTVKDCWNDYLRLPRSSKDIRDAITNLTKPNICNKTNNADEFSKIATIEFSKQPITGEWLAEVLPALKVKAPNVQSLDLASSIMSIYGLNTTGEEAIANFMKDSQVTVLNLARLNIQNITLIANSLPQSKIQILDLSNNNIEADSIITLAQILPQLQIKTLNLSENGLGWLGNNATIILAKAICKSNITILNLGRNAIGDAVIKELAQALPQSNIISLDLTVNSFNENNNDEGTCALAQVLPQSKIRNLNLAGNSVGEVGCTELAKNLPASQIYSLDLDQSYPGIKGITAFAMSLNQSKIQILNLARSDIGYDQGVSILANALPQSQLRTLGLPECIGDEGMSALANVLPQLQIQKLSFHCNLGGFGDIGVSALARKLPYSQIQTLALYSNRITDEGTSALAQGLLPPSQLNSLLLSINSIGVKGARALAINLPQSKVWEFNLQFNGKETSILRILAQGLTKVKKIELKYINIGDEGISVLAQILSKLDVRSLNLAGNNISYVGIINFANNLARSQIQQLFLTSNPYIGDKGIEALARVLPQSKIQLLDLFGNDIGNRGAKAIADVLTTCEPIRQPLWIEYLNENIMVATRKAKNASAESNTNLTHLSLPSNNISTSGAKAICQKLPQTNINITTLGLYFGNDVINRTQVNPYTCEIYDTSSASSLTPFWVYGSLTRVYQFTIHYVGDTFDQARSYLSPQDEVDFESCFSDFNDDDEPLPSEDDEHESESDEFDEYVGSYSPDFLMNPQDQPLLANVGFFSHPRLDSFPASRSASFNQPTFSFPATPQPQLSVNGLIAWYVLYKAVEPLVKQTASGIKGLLVTSFTMMQQFWQKAPTDTTPETTKLHISVNSGMSKK